jgi:4-carboxymuconolactone decarboxylase
VTEPRLPLPSDDDLPEEIRAALGGLPPLNVFRAVASLPASFRPFLQLGGSLLADPEFDARRRETAILRVAHVTRAGYEWAQHEQLGRAVGLTKAEIEAIRTDESVTGLDEEGNFVCRVADEISRDVRLSDEALTQAIERYGSRAAASLILCVAYYNMVSRFLESARVPLEDEPALGDKTPQQFAAGRRAD